ncbi:hypothetical protein [Halostagnicola sp. A-GB9-2]|uniref:hypothetical protein n=1 Tax=Halostagnicola sp. A-GB9-2 TaxID=3048066 RepID=UPI0024C00EE3|nr:hypothetical protein [Halostagnicola sp. A-GB9-2]MDJ1430559.1 hypothetical protein [Halostagnicola sp. A-GB9-2]
MFFGAYLVGISVLLWLYNMIWSHWAGPPVEDADVWNLTGTEQFTHEREWFERHLETKYGIEPTEPTRTRPSSTPDPEVGSQAVSLQIVPVARGDRRSPAPSPDWGGARGTPETTPEKAENSDEPPTTATSPPRTDGAVPAEYASEISASPISSPAAPSALGKKRSPTSSGIEGAYCAR